MPSFADANLDAALENIADNADQMDICTSDPGLTFGSISGVSVCTIALTVGDGNGDYAVDDGASSGRELNITEQTGTGSGTGAANDIALSDGSAVTYMTYDGDGDTVNSGAGVTVSAHIPITFPDPS